MISPCSGWLRSTVGRTPVSGRRTDPVLRSACSRRVTTMWVNQNWPLQISQLGELSLSSFRVDKWVAKLTRWAPPRFGGAIWWMLARWAHLIGSLAALGDVCFWQPTLWAKSGYVACPAWQCMCHCCPVWQTVICRRVCKVERFVLTN